MYKKQMVFQKITCLFCVISSAMMAIYSLGILTDIYDSFYSTMTNPNDLTDTKVPGSIIYYDMQGFNKLFLYFSIGLILLSCLLYLTNTNVRRKYYVGNYVSTIIYAVAALFVSIWSHVQISGFKKQFLTTVDFAALEEFAKLWKKTYSESTFWFDLHYFVGGLVILSAILLVINLFWKRKMMAEEDRLIEEGKEALA